MKSMAAGMLILMVFMSGISAQTSDQSDVKSIAHLFAASQYYLKKGDPDKSQRYLASLYLVLKNIEFMRNKDEAENLFQRVTGVQTGIKSFFRSMEIIDRDDRMIEIPKEPEKKSYTCSHERNGSTYCQEN